MSEYPSHLRLRARELREAGHTYRQISEQLGVAFSTVGRWLNPDYAERTRIASRDKKRVRTGVCVDCGGETRYSGHTETGVSLRCRVCGPARGVEASRARRGQGPTVERVLSLCEPSRPRGEIAEEVGITHGNLSVVLDRLLRYGLVERVARGRYRRTV